MERVAARVSARVRSEGTRAGSGTLCTEGGAPVAAASRRLPSSSPPPPPPPPGRLAVPLGGGALG